jgi:hypothetical protein
VTRGKGVPPFGEHVDNLIPVYFAEITSVRPFIRRSVGLQWLFGLGHLSHA